MRRRFRIYVLNMDEFIESIYNRRWVQFTTSYGMEDVPKEAKVIETWINHRNRQIIMTLEHPSFEINDYDSAITQAHLKMTPFSIYNND